MANADREAVAVLTVKLFDSISTFPRVEEQLLALSSAFMLMMKATAQSPSSVWEKTNNILYDPIHSDRMKSQFAGLALYLQDDAIDVSAV